MFYLQSTANQLTSDGIGAIVQNELICSTLANYFDVTYTFPGFKGINHYQLFGGNVTDFTNDITKFFNFTENIPTNQPKFVVCDTLKINDFVTKCKLSYKDHPGDVVMQVSSRQLNRYYDGNVKSFEKLAQESCSKLKDRIVFDDALKYFEHDVINVAFHIRSLVYTDTDPSKQREYYTEKNKQYYITVLKNVIDCLNASTKKYKIHIYTSSKTNQFEYLSDLLQDKATIKFHHDEMPLTSLYHMIDSNVLIMANSSFSRLAHMYGKPITLVRNTFWHSTFSDNTLMIDSSGNFNKDSLLSSINSLLSL